MTVTTRELRQKAQLANAANDNGASFLAAIAVRDLCALIATATDETTLRQLVLDLVMTEGKEQ